MGQLSNISLKVDVHCNNWNLILLPNLEAAWVWQNNYLYPNPTLTCLVPHIYSPDDLGLSGIINMASCC